MKRIFITIFFLAGLIGISLMIIDTALGQAPPVTPKCYMFCDNEPQQRLAPQVDPIQAKIVQIESQIAWRKTSATNTENFIYRAMYDYLISIGYPYQDLFYRCDTKDKEASCREYLTAEFGKYTDRTDENMQRAKKQITQNEAILEKLKAELAELERELSYLKTGRYPEESQIEIQVQPPIDSSENLREGLEQIDIDIEIDEDLRDAPNSPPSKSTPSVPKEKTEREKLKELGLTSDTAATLGQMLQEFLGEESGAKGTADKALRAKAQVDYDAIVQKYDEGSRDFIFPEESEKYKETLFNILAAEPQDYWVNFQLGNIYFGEGDFVKGRQLHFKALLNLDQQERTKLEGEMTEIKSGKLTLEDRFREKWGASPETSSFLKQLQEDIDDSIGEAKEKAKDICYKVKPCDWIWIKTIETISRAESLSQKTRQALGNVEKTIFGVDPNKVEEAVF